MKKNKLVVIKGVYDTLDIMADHLANGFKKLGYEVMLFDYRRILHSMVELYNFAVDGLLAVISFDNICMDLSIESGKIIWEQLDVFFINVLVDHPLHLHDYLLKAPRNTICLCIDENHADYIKRFYPNIMLADFLAHGGTQVDAKDVPWHDRSIDVLYVGSLSSYDMQPRIYNLDKYTGYPVESIWNNVLERIKKDHHLTTEKALEEELISEGIILEDEAFREVMSDFSILDNCAVSYYREKLLKTIVEAGINVTIYGGGWEKCEWINLPNCHWAERVPVIEVLKKMYDAKIVLNSMTWFKRGSHERIMNGMLAGAVVITEESTYVLENYENGKELISFSLDEIPEVPDVIRMILSNDEFQTIADTGRARALRSECWENRAEEIDRCLLASIKDNN